MLIRTLRNPIASTIDVSGATATQHLSASITDRTQWYTLPGLSGTGTTQRTTRTYFVAAVDCADLTFWWAGMYNDESTALTNPFTIKASFEAVSGPSFASGALYPITFGGASSIQVIPGQVVRSDPLPVDLARGSGFYVRTNCSVTSNTLSFPVGRRHNNDLFETTILSNDYTAFTGTWTSGGTATYSCGPVRIDGTTRQRISTLAIVGSSTFEGTDDTGDTTTPSGGYYGWGWVRRLCNGAVGLIHIAKSSESAYQFTPDHYRGRGPLISGCEYAIEGYGSNDLGAGRTLAQLQADKLRIWSALANRRMKVWTPTLHPNTTTSTDGYTTTTNQTPPGNNSLRIGLNTWIRAGAPIDPSTKAPVTVGTPGAFTSGQAGHPLSGWLEVADVIETSRNSGIYKVGYTTDGQHMTSTAAAAVVTTLTNPFV